MLRIATTIFLIAGSSALATHGSSGHSKTAIGLSPIEFLPKKPIKDKELLLKQTVKAEALLPKKLIKVDTQESVLSSFGVPKWLAEAALGVRMFPTFPALKELMPEEATKEVKEAHSDSIPVPITAKCIVIMCVQCIVTYTALAACRTYNELIGTEGGKVEAGLKAAAQTLTYGPMLCTLFIACRMRVEFLSDGKDQPQMRVHYCMYVVTFSVLANALLVLFIPRMAGRAVPLKEHLHDLERFHYLERPHFDEDESKGALIALTIMRYLLLLALYGGLAGLIVGIRSYVPPGVTDISELPLPTAAENCTMILTLVFFTTQLVIAVSRTYEEFTRIEFPAVAGVMNAATTASEYAPMLAILFLSAQMRAVQHSDQPQLWAQSYMFMATGSMCISTLLAVLTPTVIGGQMSMNPFTRETTFVTPDPMLGYIFLALRFVCVFSFYGGAIGVAASIFAFQAPIGATLPVPPTVRCVLCLVGQFFFVYIMMTAVLTLSEVSGGKYPVKSFRVYKAIEDARMTVSFAPVLSILCVTVHMYALLITDFQGAPQVWVQDGMVVSTGCLLLSLLACLLLGLMRSIQTEKDGNTIKKSLNRYAAIVVTAFRYVMLLGLCYCIVMIIAGLFVLTPATASGRGSHLSVISKATPLGQGA